MRFSRQRVALVTPFFGRDLRGRRERFAFAFANHLALEGVGVEVITTTARDDAADANFFRAGIDNTEAFPVHRFRVTAPDRVAYAEAVLALEREIGTSPTQERALVDERLRSDELIAHLRVVADRYDAFIFLDASAATTVHGVGEVAETALIVPLFDDPRVARVEVVAETLRAGRLILCASDVEATIVADVAGGAMRNRIRIIGCAADVIPIDDVSSDRMQAARRMQPYIVTSGEDAELVAALRTIDVRAIPLEGVEERDRAAMFVAARAVAISGNGIGLIPDLLEAWSYGKPVIATASAVAVASLIRQVGGGYVIAKGEDWETTLRDLNEEQLRRLGIAGAAYVSASGGWPGVARRTSEAVDAIAALDDGRSRETLLAQIGFLYPLVQRQRRAIEAMRMSRFWRLRDAWFHAKRRMGIGPAEDPIQEPSPDERTAALAAIGDQYQLFREQHRLRREDVDRMRMMLRYFPRRIAFTLIVDARGRDAADIGTTLRSLREQIYADWSVRVLIDERVAERQRLQLDAFADRDGRFTFVEGCLSLENAGEFVGPLDPGDVLEPHALFSCALMAQEDDIDVFYSDEDVLDEQGIPRNPRFKSDWSPETILTRDYVGRLLFFRSTCLEEVGGVREVLGSARWYDALLRVSEHTNRIHHVAEVLCHRSPHNATDNADIALAVESALRRRREDATVRRLQWGVEVRYAHANERVTIIIPTRDRADLLSTCLHSVFERSTYHNFDVIVVDNGSRETSTSELLQRWRERQPSRFRVLRDPAAFNYPRLNNNAVGETTSPYVVLLNNDTEVITPDWLEAMLGQARRPAIGAVGAMLVYSDDTVQHAGVLVGILGLAGHAHRYASCDSPGYHGALQLDTNYLAVTGACLMVSRAKYEEVGGLDESFAVSSNDVDFCLKLHRAGYRNVYVPRARLRHYESKSRGLDTTPGKVARTQQEIALIRERWPELSRRDPYYNPNLTADAEDFEVRL